MNGKVTVTKTKSLNFTINELDLSGDRKINYYISENLKTFQNTKEKLNIYNIFITSNYLKEVANRNSKGDPKNYKLRVKIDVKFIKNYQTEIKKSYEKNIILPTQSKKFDEKELEETYKKNLSNLIAEDIISFLIND